MSYVPVMNQGLIALHGATGTQGAAIAAALTARDWSVRSLARRVGEQRGAVAVDQADSTALAEAYRGAQAVVVQLPLVFDAGVIDRQVDGIVGALQTAGTSQVVLNTNAPVPPAPIGVPFVDGRVRLASTLRDFVPRLTVVAPLFAYMENLAIPSSRDRIVDDGELAYPVPEHYEMPWLAVADLAGLVANLLEDSAPPDSVLMAGPQALRGSDAAEAMTYAVGRPVRWVTIDHAAYEVMLVPHLGPEAGSGVASFYAAPPAPSDMSAIPGLVRGTTTFREWVNARQW